MVNVGGVNGRHDAGIVLEFVEVVVCSCAGVVEWVIQPRIKGTKREFVDYVGEVEYWYLSLEAFTPIFLEFPVAKHSRWKKSKRDSYDCDPDVSQSPCIHVLWR